MFSRLSCGKIQPLLGEYGEGALPDPAQQARVEAHLRTCARCRKAATAYQKSADALQAFAAHSTPPVRAPRWEAVAARIQAPDAAAPAFPVQKSRRRRPVLLGFGASGLAFAAVATVMWGGTTRTTEAPRLSQKTSSTPVVSAASYKAPFVSDRRIILSAEPCFRLSDSAPLVVKVQNYGPSVVGELVTRPANYASVTRTYRQRVSLPGEGAVSRFFVYPAGSQYPYLASVSVSLYGPFQTITVPTMVGRGGSTGSRIGYIGKGLGVLKATKETLQNQRYNNVQYCYALPENAPDRVIGYVGLRQLVLGQGSESLHPRQWKAIRDWVKQGGSLILLGGKKMAYLQTPEARELLQGAQAAGKLALETPTRRFTGDTNYTMPEFATKERMLGVGRIVFVDFDPTTPEYRRWTGLAYMWNHLTEYARAPIPQDSIRYSALAAAPWLARDYRDAASPPAAKESEAGIAGGINPFEIKMPPLRAVLYVFLAYFLLAIPFTFITLKRLRRMNMAWVTGPVLAAAFAGGLYLFTADLYTAKMSRRTTGVLIAAAGEREARFIGYSEIFFPRAGQYDVTVPNAETTEVAKAQIFDGGSGQYLPQEGQSTTLRDLETRDSGSTVSVPALQVNSLAFRRLYHEQPVTLGEGITATLREDTATGRIVGVINNRSGRTISDSTLCLGVRLVVKEIANQRRMGFDLMRYASLGVLPPGETKVAVQVKEINPRRSYISDISQLGRSIGLMAGQRQQKVPYLVGTLHGSEFGPKQGQWVGGEKSVQVIVGMDPLVKGGAK